MSVVYTWNGQKGTEPLIRQHVLDELVAHLNNIGGSVIGDDNTERTVKVTVELNPPVQFTPPPAIVEEPKNDADGKSAEVGEPG